MLGFRFLLLLEVIIPHFINYLKIPYKEGGRSFEGVDCYGLVLLLLKNEFKIDVEPLLCYKSTRDFDSIEKQVKLEAEKFEKIPEIKDLLKGDVLVFKVRGKFNAHCGVYLGESFIHAEEKIGVAKCLLFTDYWLSRFSFGLRLKNAI